jgi:hypothetical protein
MGGEKTGTATQTFTFTNTGWGHKITGRASIELIVYLVELTILFQFGFEIYPQMYPQRAKIILH